MKIMFITEVGDRKGIGGHLYTLRALVTGFAGELDCAVVRLGSAATPALDDLPCPLYRLEFERGIWRRPELEKLRAVIRRERPEVLHALDPVAGALARVAARREGCGLVLTLCGGPNPSGRFPFSYFPRVPHLVVFSRENEQYFRRHPDFRGTRLWRIPQRANEVSTDPAKVAALRSRLRPDCPVILRIGRLTRTYGTTAHKSIQLVRQLTQDGIPVQLVFVGVVQDPEAERDIRRELGEHGLVVSQPEFVAQAAQILDAGDLVVGTGRGLMEAAARSRILLVPARCGQFPALLTPDNWEAFSTANFSERSEVTPWDEQQNYCLIQRVLTEPDYRRQLAAFSRRLFEEQFLLSRAIPEYRALYEAARVPERGRYIDLGIHWLSLIWRTRGRPLAGPQPSSSPVSQAAGIVVE